MSGGPVEMPAPGGLAWIVRPNPASPVLGALARLSGEACHYAEPYLRAVAGETGRLVAFMLCCGAEVRAFGAAVEEGGPPRRRLTFPTLPHILDPEPAVADTFWGGIRRHCRARRVAHLLLQSFEGTPLPVPPLGLEVWRRDRTEFVVDLTAPPEALLKAFASNHRRNIRKAETAGLSFRVVATLEACREHAALVAHSMGRRRERGERVPGPDGAEAYHRLVAAGAGQIMRLEGADGQALSSFLMLITPRCAYYDSGGTGEQGMGLGASHGLMWRAIQHLRERGVAQLNLGGITAEDSEGLRRYKAGFGAREVRLAHREFVTVGPVRRGLWQAAEACLRAPGRLMAAVRGGPGNGAH